MKIGLTLGKYAPFHKGHEHVVQTALDEMDHVIVLIYACPETTSIPLSKRAQWIRDLYPEVEVIEAPDGPTETGSNTRIKKLNEDYIIKKVGNRSITHFYSSEFYGEHVSSALDCVNRLLDKERNRFPISGTAIRNAPFQNKTYINDRVYRDLVSKIAFVGAPSTGKTTLARTLATKFNTQWMPEYGREYWEKHHQDRRLSPEQLVEIAEGHLDRENALLLKSNRFLFIDTNAITTYLFAIHYHGIAHPKLSDIANRIQDRYQTTFLCADDIPYDDTWCRSGEANRAEFQASTIVELNRRNIDFTTLTSTLSDRISLVERSIRLIR